jgi:DNA-binding CsgD family transcriptional regulator
MRYCERAWIWPTRWAGWHWPTGPGVSSWSPGGRPRRDATSGRDALTPGELRVAQLAAAGHTNRQIAQALFVTQRTVENHLTSTYAKLQISSRAGLPAALGTSAAAGAPPQTAWYPPPS